MSAPDQSTTTNEASKDEFDYASNSQIKNIYLQIPGGYKYRHQSLNNSDEGFLGRRQISNSFADILNSKNRKGVYLVTGYRGMGKTSFVKQVLLKLGTEKEVDKATRVDTAKTRSLLTTLIGRTYLWRSLTKFCIFLGIYNDPKQTAKGATRVQIKKFFISLAQSQLKDVDILKHIVNQLLASLEDTPQYRIARWSSLGNVFGWLWPLITTVLISMNFYLVHAVPGDDSKTVIENLIGIATLAAILAVFLHKVIFWTHSKFTLITIHGKKLVSLLIILILLITLIFIRVFLPDLIYNFNWVFDDYLRIKIPELNPLLSIQGLFIIVVSFSIIMLTIKFISSIDVYTDNKKPIGQLHERLKMLHERCNAQITKEDQLQETFAVSMSSLFNKHQKVYPIANPREIENELIQIIDQLKEHYQYIFVFDELDKVDPDFENAVPISDDNGGKITYLNDLRERRHLITNILASLKYFINEAEAKFIFIAGREMFEAALADISDRQSSISSIFHKVIYVDSFLKDRTNSQNHVSAIGGLVEAFLNSILLKQSSGDLDFFSQYYKFLTSATYNTTDPNQEPIHKANILSPKQARKVIFTLQNFLGYLVYRSNGSPKKITKLLEEYVFEINLTDDSTDYQRNIVFNVTQPQELNHYLCFSYMDQYKLGYTAYLFQPFLTMNSSFMKRYSDNTLVSISYLIDNLIKFHPFAFSAQNLELLPEILATSRTPISRPFLEELVSFLAQNHIRKTESGLYEYKFYDRTHNEITFISKLFEDEAAAFNFTLDETFSIKAHLQAKIRHLRSAHTSPDVKTPIVSIVFLNRLLGDARFQDEEYQDAIISYQDALHMLNIGNFQHVNQVTSFMLLKLKLGLTYEKIKAYEFALGHYAGVIEEGSALLEKDFLKHKIIFRELMVILMQAFLATLYLQEKLQEGITFQKIKHHIDSFTNLLKKFDHDYENRDILAASFFSGIGTALYFKNMVLPQKVNEKWVKSIQTPTQEKKETLLKEVLKCFSSNIDPRLIEESLNEVSMFRDPATINSDTRISFTTYIYYKNSFKILLGSKKNTFIELLHECPKLISPGTKDDITYRSLQHTRRLSSLGHILAKLGDFLFPSITTQDVQPSEAIGCFYFEDNAKNKNVNQILESRTRFFEQYLKKINKYSSDFGATIHPRFLVHLYYLSALFYLEAGDRSNAVFQLRKILFVFRSVKLINTDNIAYKTLRCLEFNLMRRILELSSLMSHSSDRPQLAKYKKYFDIHTSRTPHEYSNELYGNLSNNPDTKETILAYALLRMKYFTLKTLKDKTSLKEQFFNIPEHKLLSPYNSISHQITRLMELELHTKINYILLNSYLNTKIKIDHKIKTPKGSFEEFKLFGKGSHWENDYFHDSKLYDLHVSSFLEKGPKQKSKNNINNLKSALDSCNSKNLWLEEYVSITLNSIFNLTQMKRIVNTFGHNYILSYSYLAKIHQDLGTWLKHLHLCRIIEPESEKGQIDKRLIELIGFQDSISLDALTEYQMAVQYYYFSIQMHKEGTIYRNRMNNLIYLEDDFNDNLYHFGAALERLKINSHDIRDSIAYLKTDLHKANMYKYTTFIGDESYEDSTDSPHN